MAISAENLRPGQTIFVDGFISFSRLARAIEGAELARRTAESKSLYPTLEPHTTISLVDAVVVYADPNNPTDEELFVAKGVYTSAKGANAGRTAYSIDNKGTNLPAVFQPNEVAPGETQTHSQLILKSDLATGLKVTLVLNTFDSKHPKKGVGLQQVILHEPAKYYSAGGNTAALSARGIIITGDVKRVTSTDAAAAGAQAGPAETGDSAGYPANTDPATGLPLPGNPEALGLPAPAAVAQVVVPVAAAQVAPTPVAVPAPVVAPAPVAAPAAPVETEAQELARLRAAAAAPVESAADELARLRAAATGSNSAFTAPVENPWSETAAPAAAPQGIAYTGG